LATLLDFAFLRNFNAFLPGFNYTTFQASATVGA